MGLEKVHWGSKELTGAQYGSKVVTRAKNGSLMLKFFEIFLVQKLVKIVGGRQAGAQILSRKKLPVRNLRGNLLYIIYNCSFKLYLKKKIFNMRFNNTFFLFD